ncbi:MAG: UDP-glucose 4-epimerase [Ilumatobacteraceae bacterium]|jgi:UDP-glucose 4-epimerase
MRGQRVLVSGMGGELGSLVASLLEGEPWVGSILGIDADPPRRRLRRSEFHLIEPSDRERIVDVVTRFDPHVLIHLAVWEPDARAGTSLAKRLTAEAATSYLAAAAECPSLEAIVVRSGIEIYGRGRGALSRPDEEAPITPTSEYGRMVSDIEANAQRVGRRVGVAVGALRLAPVLGPHVPSPLGRVLRQPVVPFSVLADPPFVVTLDSEAAHAIVAAAEQRVVGPLNVVAPGAISTMQAIRRGRRLPLPLLGPEWRVARQISYLLGAPVPEHVMELIHRGRLADGSRLTQVLGLTPRVTTQEVIDRLFKWEAIVRLPTVQAA